MAECTNPFTVKRQGEPTVTVPCGKCWNCYRKRVSHWSHRLMIEEKHSLSANFITLTYDWDNVPIGKESRRMELRKKDLQQFFKRLRYYQDAEHKSLNKEKPIKYYGVGEYGGRTHRPHYHIILFNADVELISKAWTMGSIYYGDVSGASVGYVLKYLSKSNKLHRNDKRTKPFNLVSTKLGIDYITPAMLAWHKADLCNRMYATLEDGKKISLSRYYKNKIYTPEEKLLAGTVTREKMLLKQFEDTLKREAHKNTRRVRYTNHIASEKRHILLHQTELL